MRSASVITDCFQKHAFASNSAMGAGLYEDISNVISFESWHQVAVRVF